MLINAVKTEWNKEIECQKTAVLENGIREDLPEEVTLERGLCEARPS